MTACLVFFNGPSLYTHMDLPKRCHEIGCNHIQEIRPQVDHVVCYDPEMREQIRRSPGHSYWCKNGHRNESWGEVCYPMIDAPQCSGTLAVRLALQLGYRTIRILGCDWGRTDASVFQHLYRTVSARKHSNSKVRQMDRWMRQWDVRVVSDHATCFATPAIPVNDFLSWHARLG